jgi:hypothetical protein
MGEYRFNNTPIAPPGINTLMYISPEERPSWGAHAIDGHYVGPALGHYRCYTIYNPATRRTRISDTVVWFPHEIPMPGASSTDIIAAALQDIVSALQNPTPEAPISPLAPTQVEALQQLTTMFSTAKSSPSPLAPLPRVDKETASEPRVPEKTHRYPTRSAPMLPPARDSAFIAKPSSQPPADLLHPTGGGTNVSEGEADMITALVMSDLQDIIDSHYNNHTKDPAQPEGFAFQAIHQETGEALHSVDQLEQMSPGDHPTHPKRLCTQSSQCRHRCTRRISQAPIQLRRQAVGEILC